MRGVVLENYMIAGGNERVDSLILWAVGAGLEKVRCGPGRGIEAVLMEPALAPLAESQNLLIRTPVTIPLAVGSAYGYEAFL